MIKAKNVYEKFLDTAIKARNEYGKTLQEVSEHYLKNQGLFDNIDDEKFKKVFLEKYEKIILMNFATGSKMTLAFKGYDSPFDVK
jgi:hypothetical protein